MNWENFENKRILGTVPVEEDGSAHFNAPSNTFLFFQLLDENKRMIQSMRTGTIIQPGDKGLFFNASYTELWNKNQTGAIGAGPAEIQQARSWGSNASPLMLLANRGATGIDGISAVVSGELVYSDSDSAITVTVCWGEADGGDEIGAWENRMDLAVQPEGDFSATLNGLVPGKQLYFRVFASNADGSVGAYDSTAFDTRSLIDLDRDGMADAWETAHFGSSTAEAGNLDKDGDGQSNVDEYWAGTDPTDPQSCLKTIMFGPQENGCLLLRWQSADKVDYGIWESSNMVDWLPIEGTVPATPPLNEVEIDPDDSSAHFFRVGGRHRER